MPIVYHDEGNDVTYYHTKSNVRPNNFAIMAIIFHFQYFFIDGKGRKENYILPIADSNLKKWLDKTHGAFKHTVLVDFLLKDVGHGM
jgi:hypothetical protein